MRKVIFLVLAVMLLTGCEVTRKILGTSTRHLERARVDAISQTFDCTFDQCYEWILQLDRKTAAQLLEASGVEVEDVVDTAEREDIGEIGKTADEGPAVVKKKPGFFDVFQTQRVKGLIVVMGIEGNIDTTEVGIFLTPVMTGETAVEVTSLSSSAKRKTALAVFEYLEQKILSP